MLRVMGSVICTSFDSCETHCMNFFPPLDYKISSSNMRFADQIVQRFVLYILVTDDAEAQGQDHSWASEVRSTIQSYKNGAAPEVLIRKVPNYLRVPPEQFTPTEWRFGLHDRELHTSGAEGLKIAVAGYFFADKESDAWDNFCNDVVDDPVRFVRLYGLQDGLTKFSERQVKYLLALDALFLVEDMRLFGTGLSWICAGIRIVL
jgi:hypothetical protein